MPRERYYAHLAKEHQAEYVKEREKSKPDEYDTATREAFFQRVKDGCFMPGRRRKRDSKESGEELKSDVKNTGDSDSYIADDEFEDDKKAKRNMEPPPSPKETFPGRFYNGMSKITDMYQDPRGPLRVMNPDPTSGDEAGGDKCPNGQAKNSSPGNDSNGSPAPRPKNDAEGSIPSKADANGSPTPCPKSDVKEYSATRRQNNLKESHTVSAESLDNSARTDRVIQIERLAKASPTSAESLDNGVRNDRAIQTEWLAKSNRSASAEPLDNDVRNARIIQTEWLRRQRQLDYREQEIRRAEHIQLMKERDPMYEYPNWPVVNNHDHQSAQYANIYNAPPTLGHYSVDGFNPAGMAPNGQEFHVTPPSLRPGTQGPGRIATPTQYGAPQLVSSSRYLDPMAYPEVLPTGATPEENWAHPQVPQLQGPPRRYFSHGSRPTNGGVHSSPPPPRIVVPELDRAKQRRLMAWVKDLPIVGDAQKAGTSGDSRERDNQNGN